MGHKSQRMTICTSCKHTGENCHPGIELIQKLRSATAATCNLVGEDFEISGIVSMTGCKRACAIAYLNTKDQAHIFGDIDPQSNISDLTRYAKQYSDTAIAESSSTHKQSNFDVSMLSKIPSMMITLESCEMLNS